MFMQRSAAVLASVILCLAAPASAATLHIPYTITHQIDVTSLDGTGGFEAVLSQEIVTEGPAGFSAELGTIDTIVWESSVTGGRFVVDPPGFGSNLATIKFEFDADPPVVGGAFDSSATIGVEFLGLQGTAPSVDFESTFHQLNGGRFSARVDLALADPFSFTGFRFTVTDPFSGPLLDYVPNNMLPTVDFFHFGDFNQPAPDPFLFFIPEPASVAMLGIGGLLLARRRKR